MLPFQVFAYNYDQLQVIFQMYTSLTFKTSVVTYRDSNIVFKINHISVTRGRDAWSVISARAGGMQNILGAR